MIMKKYIKSDYDYGDYTNEDYQDVMATNVELYIADLAQSITTIMRTSMIPSSGVTYYADAFDIACNFITNGKRPSNFKLHNNEHAEELIRLGNKVLPLATEAVKKLDEAYDLLSDARDLLYDGYVKSLPIDAQDRLGY